MSFVRSINNAFPDNNGNIDVNSGGIVKTETGGYILGNNTEINHDRENTFTQIAIGSHNYIGKGNMIFGQGISDKYISSNNIDLCGAGIVYLGKNNNKKYSFSNEPFPNVIISGGDNCQDYENSAGEFDAFHIYRKKIITPELEIEDIVEPKSIVTKEYVDAKFEELKALFYEIIPQ